MNLEYELKKHFAEDQVNFKKIDDRFDTQEKDHIEFRSDLKLIKEFMENLDGINNIVRGGRLLKTPSLWLLGLVVGIVALFGGIRTIISWFIIK